MRAVPRGGHLWLCALRSMRSKCIGSSNRRNREYQDFASNDIADKKRVRNDCFSCRIHRPPERMILVKNTAGNEFLLRFYIFK